MEQVKWEQAHNMLETMGLRVKDMQRVSSVDGWMKSVAVVPEGRLVRYTSMSRDHRATEYYLQEV
jgi:hypothetical protein